MRATSKLDLPQPKGPWMMHTGLAACMHTYSHSHQLISGSGHLDTGGQNQIQVYRHCTANRHHRENTPWYNPKM